MEKFGDTGGELPPPPKKMRGEDSGDGVCMNTSQEERTQNAASASDSHMRNTSKWETFEQTKHDHFQGSLGFVQTRHQYANSWAGEQNGTQ